MVLTKMTTTKHLRYRFKWKIYYYYNVEYVQSRQVQYFDGGWFCVKLYVIERS